MRVASRKLIIHPLSCSTTFVANVRNDVSYDEGIMNKDNTMGAYAGS